MYINTDLDLISGSDIRELVGALEQQGLFALHVARREDGFWYASLETVEQYASPEPNVAAIIDAVESLPDAHWQKWLACSSRELNIGYQCGRDGETRSHFVSSELLGRIAAVQATLAFTMYPVHPE